MLPRPRRAAQPALSVNRRATTRQQSASSIVPTCRLRRSLSKGLAMPASLLDMRLEPHPNEKGTPPDFVATKLLLALGHTNQNRIGTDRSEQDECCERSTNQSRGQCEGGNDGVSIIRAETHMRRHQFPSAFCHHTRLRSVFCQTCSIFMIV